MNKVSNDILSRVYILFGVFLFVGAMIVLRMIGLQLNREHWLQQESEEWIDFKRLVADRGNIHAEDGTIMATSLPFYRIAMDATIIDTTQFERFNDSLYQLASLLATRFGEFKTDSIVVDDTTVTYFQYQDTLEYYRKVRQAMASGDRHVYLTRKVLDFKELKEVKTWPIISRGRLEGGFIEEKIHNKRYYPFGDLAKITLGSMAQDTIGIRGIEYAYNEELRGRDGYMLVQKVAGNTYIPLDKYGEETAIDGMDIVTTLDVDLQDVVETALARGVRNNFAAAGTAILLEVNTGKIKAIANYPEDLNRGIGTRFEPGSTFKLAAAAAALEDGIIDLCDTVDTGDGTIMYDDKEVSDDEYVGVVPFEVVFAHSSNVGMSKVIFEGYGETPQRFLDHLKRFGFEGPANQQIVGEPEPLIYEPGDQMWNIATLPSMAYGYSLEVTPIQMAAFYNTIANNGRRIRPWIVKEIRRNSRVVQSFGPEVLDEQVLSPETIEKVQYLLERVVQDGTATRAMAGLPFPVAGKTGTVRKNINGTYVRLYRASFGGYFPADNPRYTCYVMIDEPRGRSASGGKVAGPVFREIAERIYGMDLKLAGEIAEIPGREVPDGGLMYAPTSFKALADLGIDEAVQVESHADWASIEQVEDSLSVTDFEPGASIPDVRGMSARDAISLLEEMGLQVKLVGFGRVRRQSLLPGYRMGKNTAITLYLR